MNIIDWLLRSDPAVQRLTKKYLLSENADYREDGWIQKFLSYYDSNTYTWGNGIYGPKWISTFYTLRDLVSLEIDPGNLKFQNGLKTLIREMWNPTTSHAEDHCVVAMLLSLLIYGGYQDGIINEMIDYLLDSIQPDGGWNCAVLRSPTKKSSVHTTLSVLEAFRDAKLSGNTPRLSEIDKAVPKGEEYLLKKKLMRRESDNSLIFKYIDKFHFPTRWKYDVLKVLVYFASVEHPYDDRMKEGLDLLKIKIRKGYLPRGPTHTGKHHFKMEHSKIGGMNTFRGLYVLKFYDIEFYQEILRVVLN